MTQLHFKVFEPYAKLAYGFSERPDGEMLLANDPISELARRYNRQNFLAKYDISEDRLVVAGLVHGVQVALVNHRDAGQVKPATDSLVTATRNIFLSVTAADCFPVFLYDPKKQVAGLIHAGWQGTAQNIVGNAVDKMCQAFGAHPADIRAGIGPGIAACHFEIKKDILSEFAGYKGCVAQRKGKLYVDLPSVLTTQLLESGLKSGNIETSGFCTFCSSDRYFSFRRDKPKKLRASLAFIGIR